MTYLTALIFQPIAGEDCEIKKIINSGPLDWTKDSVYVLDTTISNQLLEVQNLQSIFVDNPGTGVLVISVNITGQVLRIASGSQAFLPLYCSDRPVITFTNVSGNGISQAWLSNKPCDALVYKTS